MGRNLNFNEGKEKKGTLIHKKCAKIKRAQKRPIFAHQGARIDNLQEKIDLDPSVSK